jgi:hypothetical protein
MGLGGFYVKPIAAALGSASAPLISAAIGATRAPLESERIWMEAARRWYKLGLLGGAVALLVLTFAVVSGAQASGTYKSCGNKKITIQIEDGEGGTRPYKVWVKSVSAKGLSCQAAFEFIRGAYVGDTGKFTCKAGDFTVPTGYYPQICSKGTQGVKYGQQGG